MNFATAILVLFLIVGTALADENFDCDRSGDHKVTTVDALSALQDSVDTCRKDMHCDANRDDEETAADALLLLRFAVGLPAELACGCTYVDQCFGDDEDCVDSGFPDSYRCTGSLCVECIENTDCEDGQICDTCHYVCVAEP
ncbi:MAG TPA: hypothetical protein VN634_15710 [Candidatus Limnocylindrales bacterium]|nr:hypothetical protein [Candidatus Limnocylindrales bacterium]